LVPSLLATGARRAGAYARPECQRRKRLQVVENKRTHGSQRQPTLGAKTKARCPKAPSFIPRGPAKLADDSKEQPELYRCDAPPLAWEAPPPPPENPPLEDPLPLAEWPAEAPPPEEPWLAVDAAWLAIPDALAAPELAELPVPAARLLPRPGPIARAVPVAELAPELAP